MSVKNYDLIITAVRRVRHEFSLVDDPTFTSQYNSVEHVQEDLLERRVAHDIIMRLKDSAKTSAVISVYIGESSLTIIIRYPVTTN